MGDFRLLYALVARYLAGVPSKRSNQAFKRYSNTFQIAVIAPLPLPEQLSLGIGLGLSLGIAYFCKFKTKCMR